MGLKFTDYGGFQLAHAAEHKRHRRALERLEDRRREIEKACAHPERAQTYFPDPSGNNDSFHRCNLCGKEY